MQRHRYIAILLSLLLCAWMFAGCAQGDLGSENNASELVTVESISALMPPGTEINTAVKPGKPSDRAVRIILNGSSASSEASGISITDSRVTITSGGIYELTGSFSGCIEVDAGKNDDVVLILNGVNISCPDYSAINIVKAGKAAIETTYDSVNILSDGKVYSFADPTDDEPDATIFSKTDLEIRGSGELTVIGNYECGIRSKDDLLLNIDGILTVISVGDGIKGKDCVIVDGKGKLSVTADGDGIRSNNTEDEDRGYIAFKGCSTSISSELDGVQAESLLTVSGGLLNIKSGGGSADSMNVSSGKTDSCKGLKCAGDIIIKGGKVSIDSKDDSLHAGGSLAINDGTLTVSSSDDGIHADRDVSISGGVIKVLKSFEGIEGQNIFISGGTISVRAADDGINCAGGSDTSYTGSRGFMGKVEDCTIDISGGLIYVNADGDGIDSNNDINVSGGTLLVSGPTDSRNGALDYETELNVTGGTILAAGASGMAKQATSVSGCRSVMYTFDRTMNGEILISVCDGEGRLLLAFAPEKDFQCLAVCSDLLGAEESKTIRICRGGIITGGGEPAFGVYYTSGELNDETLLSELTLTSPISLFTSDGEQPEGGNNFGGPVGGMFPPSGPVGFPGGGRNR
ncbi:MAG: carbohydrate-binding domain-containing protein [Clostridiales bacterium]|nr:carbohydrate-binding domain-containing protein [Clostridiales bacterium]